LKTSRKRTKRSTGKFHIVSKKAKLAKGTSRKKKNPPALKLKGGGRADNCKKRGKHEKQKGRPPPKGKQHR